MAHLTGGTKIPNVMWAQRKDIIYITINLEDVKNPIITLTESKLLFSGKGGTDNDLYEITLEFYKDVNPQESKYVVQARNVTFVIKKKESGYWLHLLKNLKKAFWLKTDFNKWKEEDESDDDLEKNMDMSEMMQSMGGMGDSSGPGTDMPEEEDSDDEDLPDLE